MATLVKPEVLLCQFCLRAALLPKLLLGELRVAEVEKVVHNLERQTE